jgi:hypothetical protein
MSRKRQRMEQFGEAPKLKRQLRPPEPWTLKDKLVVCGAFTAGFIALFGGPILKSVVAHRQIVNRRLAAWEAKFQLSEAEMIRLRQIESKFHGSGFQIAPQDGSHQQVDAHKRELSRAMNPKSASEFIKFYHKKNPCGIR